MAERPIPVASSETDPETESPSSEQQDDLPVEQPAEAVRPDKRVASYLSQ
jgi:hypothetical protein